MRRLRLRFWNVEVVFADREEGLEWFRGLGERGSSLVEVVYGPEGCGKTALLKQAALLLRDLGYDVLYLNPLEGEYSLLGFESLRELIGRLAAELGEALDLGSAVRAAMLAVRLAREALRRGSRRLALLLDDVFQAIGVERAASYTKTLLNLVEYPPGEYERIVAVIASSEGVSRYELGRHLWGYTRLLWNMSFDGLRELYEQLPGDELSFEKAWSWTGGNPRLLRELYRAEWRIDEVMEVLLERLDPAFIAEWRDWLERVVDDPDAVAEPGFPRELRLELVKRNLVVYPLPPRREPHWVDVPPPERDEGLGVGRYAAWQTPLHREAVRRALGVAR